MTTDEARTTPLTDPVAQQLLHAPRLARLAYSWLDGTPRVVPMWFHWTGEAFLLGAPPNAPKMQALARNPEVALSIDSDAWPYQVVTVRGTAAIELVDWTFPEYAAMARRYLGEEGGQAFLALGGQTFSRWGRITIRPDAVRLLDFAT